MDIFNFDSFSLLKAASLFAIAAIAVWIGGTKLSKQANDMSEATGTGRALMA